MSDKFKKEFDDTIDRIKKEIENLAKKIEEYLEKGEVYRAYRTLRSSVLDSLKELKKALDSVVENVKELNMSENELKELASHVGTSIRSIIDRIEDILEKFREYSGGRYIAIWYDFKPFKHFFHEIAGGVGLTVDRILDNVEEFVDRIERSFEDVGKKFSHVVSVRIREKDIEVIDKLVDAGIFKSRSEAVAFFVRKGIEVSREWVEKALEQAKKIKELQQSIRKEIDKDKEDENREENS